MAHNLNLSNAAANYAMDALAPRFNSGYLRIYSGTQPATADTALSGNTLLAELTFGSTAFGAAVAGVITANAIANDPSANNPGTASFFRCFESNGTTVIHDGSVGTSDADLVLNTVDIVAGVAVSVTAYSLTLPK